MIARDRRTARSVLVTAFAIDKYARGPLGVCS
jgi:hypothetical protein